MRHKIKTLTVAVVVTLAIVAFSTSPSLGAETGGAVVGGRTFGSGSDAPGEASAAGRSPSVNRRANPAPKPAVVHAQATKPVAADQARFVEATLGLVELSTARPAEVALGSEYVAELTVTAQIGVSNVVVRDTIPAGASYVRSDPAAVVEGKELIWQIGRMDAGQIHKHKVWLKADKEGELVSCATVSADSRVCTTTFVGKPVLNLKKVGPETALLGQDVTYNITVKNTGTAVAKGVTVNDSVPNGMSHSSGKSELLFDVGDLAPGQAKPFSVTFRANQRGKVCNTVTATSNNAGTASAEACTAVLVPSLRVVKSGTKEQILMRNADYEIRVSNTGDIPLQNVTVEDQVPTETSIVAAPGATISGNKATWTIASLAPGAKVTRAIKLTSKVAGTHCNTVTARSGELRETAKACTLWKGIAALLLEVVDDPDPIQIGESTTYTIRVTNQGFADVHNVKIAAMFGNQVTPVSAPHGTVSGKKVSFPVEAILAAKQFVTYTVTVKGDSVGDSRNKIVLIADELRTPVTEEESTTIY